jgi:hypothetical protein
VSDTTFGFSDIASEPRDKVDVEVKHSLPCSPSDVDPDVVAVRLEAAVDLEASRVKPVE